MSSTSKRQWSLQKGSSSSDSTRGALRNDTHAGKVRNLYIPFKAILLAKQGSDKHLHILAENIDTLSRHLARDAFGVLLLSLESRPPDPKASSLNISHNQWLAHERNAYIAISVAQYLSAYDEYSSVLRSLLPIVVRHWPALLTWLWSFYINETFRCEETGSYDKNVLPILAKTLNVVSFARQYRIALYDYDDSTVQLVANIWHLGSYQLACSLSGVCADILLGCPEDGTARRIFLEAGNNDEDQIANTAVSRLRRSCKEGLADISLIENFINIILGLGIPTIIAPGTLPINSREYPVSALCESLRRNHAVTALTQASIHILRKAPIIHALVLRVIVTYILALPGFLQSLTEVPWTIEAIRAGLLELLLLFLPHAVQENFIGRNPTDLVHVMLDCIVSHLELYSVLTAVLRSLRAMPDELLNNPAKVRNKDVRDKWLAFEELVLARAVVKNNYDYWKHKKIVPCFSCKVRKPRGKLLKCHGCDEALFCSKVCQVAGWKTQEHREQCKALQLRFQSDSLPSKYHDREFIKRVASFDVRRHVPVLCAETIRRYPNMSPHSLARRMVYIVDYKGVFSLLSVEIANDGNASDICSVTRARRMCIQVTYIGAARLDIAVQEPAEAMFDNGRKGLIPPTLRPDAHTLEGMKRAPCCDLQGRPLEACYDEVDEMVRRIRKESKLSSKSVWLKIDEVMKTGDDREVWPFLID
ncbi:hypothetical protein EW145_g5128 [Phellinidium pouzarii]|uniref:MYND-type domain-containing protein n=1 Tax=Phellinidium pouzarii TaxID=167371 RepID=A0A4S4L191_9AGAM|nr:hypothetical protein EW145_g5128 [Phellinidium pouzarii]